MPILPLYLLLAVTPAACLLGGLKALEWFATWDGPRSRRPSPTGPTIERLARDLRRLEREYLVIEVSDMPARAARLRSVSLAYDDTLRACCLALDLPQPSQPPLGGLVRLQTEAALAQRGLVW